LQENRKMVNVVAGLVLKDGKVILAKRKKGDPLEGLWEFPGGKVEKNENLFEALVRELKEELNIKVKPIKVLEEIEHHYPHISFRMYLILALTNDDPVAIESEEIILVTLEDVDSINLAPADRIIWKKINKTYGNISKNLLKIL